MIKVKQDRFEQIIRNTLHPPSQSSKQAAGMLSCSLAFSFILWLRVQPDMPVYAAGVLSQIQVLLSVILTVRYAGKGYLLGILLNVINLISILYAVFQLQSSSAITGILVTLFTFLSISLIYLLVNNNAKHHEATLKQKEELITLTNDLLVSKEELRRHNEKLIEYTQLIKKNEQKLNHLAYFDTLTELPNRKMILDRLNLLIDLSQNNHASFAIVFIDLDNFKKINDTLGHSAGDQLIVEVARRLYSRVHKNDLLGRLGGDEFALIIQQNIKNEEILPYVENLREHLEKPFSIGLFEGKISASFGISIYPQDGITADDLIKYADTAMYKVKESGKNGIYFFKKEMLDEILQKIHYEQLMMAALKNGEFSLAFQPQFSTFGKTIRGLEALARWQSAEEGIISPAKFIPLAEETGLIIPLGQWILHTACATFHQWIRQYQIESILSVNISAVQFEDPGFMNMVRQILAETGLPGRFLEIEITEGVLIKSISRTIQILEELQEMGIHISLDDFGTGYSSLRYLQLLPINTLKIDKSFIDTIDSHGCKDQIVGSIIHLVHQMNMDVIAEGVENEIQLDYLKKEKCDWIQGYLLGAPLSEVPIGQWVERQILKTTPAAESEELSHPAG